LDGWHCDLAVLDSDYLPARCVAARSHDYEILFARAQSVHGRLFGSPPVVPQTPQPHSAGPQLGTDPCFGQISFRLPRESCPSEPLLAQLADVDCGDTLHPRIAAPTNRVQPVLVGQDLPGLASTSPGWQECRTPFWRQPMVRWSPDAERCGARERSTLRNRRCLETPAWRAPLPTSGDGEAAAMRATNLRPCRRAWSRILSGRGTRIRMLREPCPLPFAAASKQHDGPCTLSRWR